MGGVDHFDQLHSAYNISWKSRRWWLKLFYYCLDAAIVNSFILYQNCWKNSNQTSKHLSQLHFRSLLADELIGNFCSRTRGDLLHGLEEAGKGITPMDARLYIILQDCAMLVIICLQEARGEGALIVVL